MIQFKNIFKTLNPLSNVNFQLVAEVRRRKMEKEGFSTDHINWEHYAKVLQAKHEIIKNYL